MSSETIPDAVMIEAERVNDEIFRIAHDEVHILNHTQRKEAIARALLAAEQRGRDAQRVEFIIWLRGWVKRRFGKWITHNTAIGAFNDYQAAIRSLGDKT